MALYGITLLPLIKHLRAAYPGVLQSWYANTGAMYGRGYVVPYFKELCRAGTMFKYYPKVKKLIRICPLADQPRLKVSFFGQDLKVKLRGDSHYVGGHVGLMTMRSCYI